MSQQLLQNGTSPGFRPFHIFVQTGTMGAEFERLLMVVTKNERIANLSGRIKMKIQSIQSLNLQWDAKASASDELAVKLLPLAVEKEQGRLQLITGECVCDCASIFPGSTVFAMVPPPHQ